MTKKLRRTSVRRARPGQRARGGPLAKVCTGGAVQMRHTNATKARRRQLLACSRACLLADLIACSACLPPLPIAPLTLLPQLPSRVPGRGSPAGRPLRLYSAAGEGGRGLGIATQHAARQPPRRPGIQSDSDRPTKFLERTMGKMPLGDGGHAGGGVMRQLGVCVRVCARVCVCVSVRECERVRVRKRAEGGGRGGRRRALLRAFFGGLAPRGKKQCA